MVPIRRLSLCIINFPIGNYVCSLLRIVSVVTYRFCILLIMPITQQTLNHRPLFIIGCILYQFSINKNNKIPHGLLIKEKKKYSVALFIRNPSYLLHELRIQAPATRNQYVLKLLHQYAHSFIPFKVTLAPSEQMLIFSIIAYPFKLGETEKGRRLSYRDISLYICNLRNQANLTS